MNSDKIDGRKRPQSPEHRLKISIANRGKKKPHSEEWRRKVSATMKRIKHMPPNWKGKRRSKTHGERLSKYLTGRPRVDMRGANNPLWRGGITRENAKIRTSLEYKMWRRSVFERDNYTCVWCGDRQSKGHKVIIHADHIKPFAQYPELRLAIDNGRTLCLECHKKTDSYLKWNGLN